MSTKRTILRNVAWNWAGMGCDALAAFLVMPFLVSRLGGTVYGLWILIGSLTNYFGLLDLGVRPAVGRYVAFHRARGDREGIDATLSTALAAAGAMAAILVLAGGTLIPLIFFAAFDVPAEQAAAVRLALAIVCVNLALTFLTNIFDAVLWAAQRFDLLNAVDIPAAVLRAGLTFYLVGRGHGLVALAWLTLGGTLLVGSAKLALALRQDRGLRLRASCVSRRSLGELFGYGVNNFVITVARMTRIQLSPFLIGALVGLPMVTLYAIARRLLDYAERVLWSATGVVTPASTALFARGEHDRQRALTIEGGKYCFMLSLYFVGFFALLGKPLIALWMGPQWTHAATLLLILVAGEALPMSQKITNGMLLAAARHRIMAQLAVAEVVAFLALAVALARPMGMVGICVALAIPALIFRGVLIMIYGCWIAGIPLTQYLSRTLFPPLTWALLPLSILVAALNWQLADRWSHLVAYTTLYTVLYAVAFLPLLGRERLASLTSALQTRIAAWRLAAK